jgi:DNA polymerase-3 subunit delta
MPSLDFDTFRRSVMKGEILPAYYLHGDEDLLKDDGLRDLLAAAVDPSTRDFNYDRRRVCDLSADEFVNLALTPPMMAARRAVVVMEAEDLQLRRPKAQALRTAIADYLARPSSDTLLVLVQSAGGKPDPQLEKLTASVSIKPLTPDKLEKWIKHRAKQEGIEIDEDGARHLQATVGADLPQLAAEIAKLRTALPGQVVNAADVEDMVGIRRGETMFDFMDAVTAREFGKATDMVRHLLEAPGTSGVRLVMALATALTGVALARALLDNGSAPGAAAQELKGQMFSSRPFGLRGYDEEARRWAGDAKKWTMKSVDAALAHLLRADKRLKNTTLGGDIEIVTEALLAMGAA